MKDSRTSWIVFDVGGVLLDWISSSDHFAEELKITHDQLFNALYAPGNSDNIGTRMNLGQLSGQQGWDEVLSQFQIHLPFKSIVSDWVAEPYWPKDTLSLLRELKHKGYKMAVFSNSWFGLTDPATKDILPDEFNLFDIVIDSAVEKMQKPNPDFYTRLEERLDAHGANIFFIDDDQKNIITAKNFGWDTFLYSMGSNASEVKPNNDKLRKLLGL